MIREQIVAVAKDLGWTEWGKLRKKRGSSYQCFRRDATYCWIGLRFIEHQNEPIAADFVADPDEAKKMLAWRS